MDNVFNLKPSINIPVSLRNIADQIEKGEIEWDKEGMTIIALPHVFHLGCWDDGRAAADAVFNMAVATNKLVSAANNNDNN